MYVRVCEADLFTVNTEERRPYSKAFWWSHTTPHWPRQCVLRGGDSSTPPPTHSTHTHTRARRKHTSVEFEIFEKRVESRGSDECGKKRKDEEEEEGKKNARVHQCFPPAFLPISTRGAGRSLQVHSPVGLARITCASPPPHHTIL